jgi:hypothetical protein
MTQPDRTDDLAPATTNRRALAGLVGSVALGVAGLFALPAIRSAFGLDFGAAFWLVLAIEFVASLGVVVSVLSLYRARSLD